MAKQEPNGVYKKGEIVLVRYRDSPNLPVHEFISYVRSDTDKSSSATLPLTNIQMEIKSNSRRGSKTLDLMFANILPEVTRLKRGQRVEKLEIGELYEVESNDPLVCPLIPEKTGGISFNVIGCYAGTKRVGGKDFYFFSNVCETDPEKLSYESKDTTYGRRVFSRVRLSKDLKITQLLRS